MFFTRASHKVAFGLLTVAFAVPAQAIVGGVADSSTSLYRYMGKMSNGFGATPIASDWLVTAAHVAPSAGSTYTNLEGTFGVKKVVKDPTGADIALVQISGSLQNYYAFGNATMGSIVTVAGFGGVGAVGTAPTGNASGARYIARNTVDTMFSATLAVNSPSFKAYAYDLDDGTSAHNLIGSALPIAGEGGLASGDSGGGWFVTVDGKPTIVAVSSGVQSQYGLTGSGSSNYFDYGGVGIGAALGQYSSFITGTIRANPVPEPSTWAALGVGAFALMRRRRR